MRTTMPNFYDEQHNKDPRIPLEQLKLITGTSSKTVWCQFVSLTQPMFRREMFVERSKYFESDAVALLIDDRNNLGYFWSIPWTLFMLGPQWRLQIIARKKNKDMFEAIISHFGLVNAYVDTFEERYGFGEWIGEGFMRKVQFMLSKQFWEGIRGEKVIIFQDHAVPLKRWQREHARIVLDQIYMYAFAGAPWSLEEDTQPILPPHIEVSEIKPTANWRHGPGGNGGFSYRNRSLLIHHGVDLRVPYDKLLSKKTNLTWLGDHHEDLVWGQILSKLEHGVAPKRLEHKFAQELLSSPSPLGMHNFFAHHSVKETVRLVQLAGKEFFGVQENVFEIVSGGENIFSDGEPWLSVWNEMKSEFPHGTLPDECV